jgi:hypothetical protein
MEATRHVRTDRDHMAVSLATIRWHLSLSLGDFAGVLASLDGGYLALRSGANTWSIGYNGSKLLLLYGFLLWKAGDHAKAAEVFDEAFFLFKRVAEAPSNDNATLFNDHRVSHRIAFLGMIAKLNMAEKPTPRGTVLDMKTVGEEVFRVRNARALKHLREKLAAMVEHLQANQVDPTTEVVKA